MINAELECKLACKKNCPDFDWDSEDFDYNGSCYKSALKAYKSLEADGHSGYSWNITKNILIRMMNGQVLSPITDDDFKDSDGNYLPARIWGRHPKGEYTMVYNVYYNNTCKTCTIHNDLPIAVDSNRGTNYLSICKRSELLGDYYSTVLETSAPIEVVSYTVKNKEK